MSSTGTYFGGVPRQVYYAERSDGLIKIGSSINPRLRCKHLGAELLVVSEPLRGLDGYRSERAVHERFAHLAAGRELFTPADDLTDHMSSLVRNEPVANKAKRWRRRERLIGQSLVEPTEDDRAAS